MVMIMFPADKKIKYALMEGDETVILTRTGRKCNEDDVRIDGRRFFAKNQAYSNPILRFSFP